MAIPVAVRFKKRVWSRLIVQIAGSNPAEGMAVRLLCLFGVVEVSAEESYRVCVCVCVCVCLIMCDLATSKWGAPGPILAVAPQQLLLLLCADKTAIRPVTKTALEYKRIYV
jgi:hypothetical protein